MDAKKLILIFIIFLFPFAVLADGDEEEYVPNVLLPSDTHREQARRDAMLRMSTFLGLAGRPMGHVQTVDGSNAKSRHTTEQFKFRASIGAGVYWHKGLKGTTVQQLNNQRQRQSQRQSQHQTAKAGSATGGNATGGTGIGGIGEGGSSTVTVNETPSPPPHGKDPDNPPLDSGGGGKDPDNSGSGLNPNNP